jgi:hypothetical protein
MCSSRHSPGELKTMLESFDKTSSCSDIAVYISEDDKYINEYVSLLNTGNWICYIGKHKYLGEVLNYFSTQVFPEYEYYQEVNDDHIYITPEWDRLLIETIEKNGNGWGIAFPNKLGEPNDFSPSAYVMSGNIVRTIGWFTLPGLRQNSIDNTIFKLGTGVNRYWYAQDVQIYHKNWKASNTGLETGTPKDDNNDFTYSKEECDHGSKISELHDYSIEIKKVNDAISKG